MKKRIGILLCSAIIAVNQFTSVGTIYAKEQLFTLETQMIEEERIYVENGEGSVAEGEGTAQSPYTNIRTALNQIQPGQTLVLVGEVSYTKYEQEADGSAKPLFIDKNITITGDTPEASLKIRTAIQLGADVTFKDMRLEMLPETILGGSGSDNTLGTIVERSATIYAAGHTLVLDGVNTKLGTSADQDNTRPYLSGGSYKGSDGVRGEHAVIKVINPIEQTKISGIYAGDYWRDVTMSVDIELDTLLVDKTIHTAGIDGNVLEGNVNVLLGKKCNATGFDKVDQLGELNVTLASDYMSSVLSFEQVHNLVLEKSARINITENGAFVADNVTLKEGAVLDFRKMSDNPVIKGNFVGVPDGELSTSGTILIKNDKTLKVAGDVNGLTRLNTNGAEYVDCFVEGHSYVEASDVSPGGFTIEGSQHAGYVLTLLNGKKKTVKMTINVK